MFEVYDYNNKLVANYSTNNKGNINIELGYGHYSIVQVLGKEEYKLADVIDVFINDEDSIHYYELYDDYIDEVVREETEDLVIEKTEDVVIEEKSEEDNVVEEIIEEKNDEFLEEEIVELNELVEDLENDILKEELVITEDEIVPEKEEVIQVIEEMPPNTGVYRATKKLIQKIINGVRRIIEFAIILSILCKKLLF